MFIVKEGIPFVLVPLVIAAIFGVFQMWPALIIFVFIAAFMLYFFRDPKRIIPMGDGLIVSAADGRVTRIEESDNSKLVSVFLSPLDVHINRSPIGGLFAASLTLKAKRCLRPVMMRVF